MHKNACRWNVVIVKCTSHTKLSVPACSARSPRVEASLEKQDLAGYKALTDTSPPTHVDLCCLYLNDICDQHVKNQPLSP